jgi:glutamyl-tRNA synthetase
MAELIEKFDINRVHKGGAKFNFEKALWYNAEWIKRLEEKDYEAYFKPYLLRANIEIHHQQYFIDVTTLIKERCTVLGDIVEQSQYFYRKPEHIDIDSLKPKWSEDKNTFFEKLITNLNAIDIWSQENIENIFKDLAAAMNIKPGELQLPLRIMLVGGKYGPSVFTIASLIEKQETIARISEALLLMQ